MSKHRPPEKKTYQQGQPRFACFGFRRVRADEKVKLVLGHFDSIARKYDFMNTLLSCGLHYLWKRLAVRVMGLQKGDRVVDLCGGTADLAILAAKLSGPSGRVVLYDINQEMMEAGMPKVEKASLSARIHYVLGDAEKVAFHEGCFDAAMVGFGIRNLTRMEEGLREMYRVLKPGGKFMCLEFSMPPGPFFRRLYDFYSFYIMPLLGKLLTGQRQAYLYLPESIRTFPSPEQLRATLGQIGFCNVVYRSCTHGVAVIHTGTKALREDRHEA